MSKKVAIINQYYTVYYIDSTYHVKKHGRQEDLDPIGNLF